MGTQVVTDTGALTAWGHPSPCSTLLPWRRAWVHQEGRPEPVGLGARHHLACCVDRVSECEKQES